ncbi:tyrosinase-like [Gastrophryne carolinensis]
MANAVWALLLILAALPGGMGFAYPRECVAGDAPFPRPCCPLLNGSRCGESLGRGNCVTLSTSSAATSQDVTMDERNGFPRSHFNAVCMCKGDFFGHDCGSCKPGWKGNDCKTPNPTNRENIMKWNQTRRNAFYGNLLICNNKIDPVWVMMQTGDRLRRRATQFKDMSYLETCIYHHYYATQSFLNGTSEQSANSFAHSGPAFLCWHRMFLLYCEANMRKCLKDDTFTFPYHPWENDTGLSLFNDDNLGGNDYSGRISLGSAFNSWTVMCAEFPLPYSVCQMNEDKCCRPKLIRKPGMNPNVPRLPTKQEIDVCFFQKNFWSATGNSFSDCLEVRHNAVHNYFLGTMGMVAIASADPYFFLLHCNLDRLFEMGLQQIGFNANSYPMNNVYGQGYYDCAGCFLQCTRNTYYMQSLSIFGVTYV